MTDTMKSKTVAVVMCTYNGEKYLREQLDSILAQTYPIHELIVQETVRQTQHLKYSGSTRLKCRS